MDYSPDGFQVLAQMGIPGIGPGDSNPVRPERSEAQPSEVEGRKFMAGGC